jgi:hypothetical protein
MDTPQVVKVYMLGGQQLNVDAKDFERLWREMNGGPGTGGTTIVSRPGGATMKIAIAHISCIEAIG